MTHTPRQVVVAQTVRRAETLIERWIGLTLSGAAPRRLYDFLEARATQLDLPDASSYLDLLEHASGHDPEVTRLINLVTNGLTAFWRDEPQLDAVRLVLEQIARDRNVLLDPITIWCAGCSTGEEAYTLAMLAAESGLNASVLGSDVNSEFLHMAMDGVYHSWSLRRLSPERRTRYFTPVQDELGGTQGSPTSYFAITPRLKAMVSFQRHNLMMPPPQSPRRAGWDVVVCRNVLIYFKENVVRGVIQKFATSLQSDGYLMLGSSEHMSAYFDESSSMFRAARHGAGFVYRLASKPPGTTVYKVPLMREPNPLQGAWSAPEIVAGDDLAESSEVTVEVPSREAMADLVQAGFKMMHKDPEHAISCFEASISYDPFATDAHYALAMLLVQHAPSQAMEVLRKMLFLKPMHWLASYKLARLHEEMGAPTRARVLYRQALEGFDANPRLFELPAPALHFEPTTKERERMLAHCIGALSRR